MSIGHGAPRRILVALDSVGIDPLGHNRPESVYADSTFLFPRDRTGPVLEVVRESPDGKLRRGVLVETDVTGGRQTGGMECALTYTSIFTGINALDRHGLMQGLGLNDKLLESLVAERNLFERVPSPCLANAIFPLHLPFLRGSYVQDLLPSVSKEEAEARLTYQSRPVRLLGQEKRGLSELFTAAEINQNIFVYAAREAGVPLRTWEDVRRGSALTGIMTHELEARFNWEALGQAGLPRREPAEAAEVLLALAGRHDFTFYKYQLADLVSHTGQVDLARAVFEVIETFVEVVLRGIDPWETVVIMTSDHGHLEQVAYSHGHPKSRVPTWYFGPDAAARAVRMRRPEGIFHVIAEHGLRQRLIAGV
jgi:Metalloenzyme superfamily